MGRKVRVSQPQCELTAVAGLLERLLLNDESLVDHVGHLALQAARRARDGDPFRACVGIRINWTSSLATFASSREGSKRT